MKKLATTNQVTVADVERLILETQEDRTPCDMHIHKSPLEDSVGAVFFAISARPPKGYAMFLPRDNDKNSGILHVFDNLGLKRKILHVTINDLDEYKDRDILKVQQVVQVLEVK